MKKLIFITCLLFCPHLVAAEALLSLNDNLFDVELAISVDERSKGLMNREKLADNQGMLFIFPKPRIVSFWMYQTLIPLDILFFDSNGQLLELFENIPPCKASPCKTYTNKIPAEFVLELPAGTAEKINVSLGNKFVIIKRN